MSDCIHPWVLLLTLFTTALRGDSGTESPLQTSSALRGPPRKPKQSGHALWVGNLPPGTQIIDLKDHFSRDATEDIESVFLISKSNCAFVNYRSVESCAAAMTRFHDSRFRGVRLVCRLRRGSNPAASPASTTVQPDSSSKSTVSVDTAGEMRSPTNPLVVPLESPSTTARSSPGNFAREKFFIVKSLTVEDLERSVVSGIWATQAHNEENLNAAFEVSQASTRPASLTNDVNRVQSTSTSSFQPINLVNTLATQGWNLRLTQTWYLLAK